MDTDIFKQKLENLNQRVNRFFNFVGMKLKNFKNLSVGEQISFSCIGLGFMLIFISLILFIV